MKENPFKNKHLGTYSKYLREVFENKKIGDTFFVETFGKSLINVRANLKYVTNYKLVTKKAIDVDGLWIKIIE